MENVTIKGKPRNIEYRETKIGDRVYDKNTQGTYIADIADADDLNWIVLPYAPCNKCRFNCPSLPGGCGAIEQCCDYDGYQPKEVNDTTTVPFNFQEFKEFLLDNEKCTTEEMERAIELVYQYLTQTK